MIKILITTLAILIVTCVAEQWLPWWIIAVIPFITSWLSRLKGKQAFLSGLIGIGLAWFIGFIIKDIPNQHILSSKMAALFNLPSYHYFIATSTVIGALVGGLAAWAGSLLSTRYYK